ncbi:MAG: efflux RND transporter periplasmic adaptor subunit [Pseudohongiella nitratireducens]|nr:efflux RND transporter periplasmic adaptor subunit [Pseudohongiella nitratireducens]MDF1624296.1 efflux RND transporter periplasmic adaptor subunit [Pseudohongiella nitratireducens]
MSQRNMLIGGVVAAVLASLAIYIFLMPEQDGMTESQTTSASRQPLYWVAPMDPDYRRDEPGLSPMGMDLVPVYEGGDDGADVSISPTVQQNLGVRLGMATSGEFRQQVDAVGYTAWDQSTIQMLHPRAEGWLEQFNVASVGDRVEAGQILYELFAPRLVSAQREYLNAAGNSSLRRAAEERLLALGVTREQVAELASNNEVSARLAYRAASDAVVSGIGAREGSYVTPTNNILTLASLNQIWIDVEVPATTMPWMELGLPVTAEFPAFPGETWQGQVALVYPELDPVTRSLRLRLALNNPGHRLKPNMFASVRVEGPPRPDIISVPREAVIRSGQGARVLTAAGNGRFNVQPVRTGVVSGDRIEILAGLSDGTEIVTSGQFLLDSEANGEQAMARLNAVESDPEQSDSQDENAETEPETLTGIGTIQSINDNGVTLSHGPIPALNWPPMTMGFQTMPTIDLSSFAEGDEIEFDFMPMPDGGYSITELRRAGMPTQGDTQ